VLLFRPLIPSSSVIRDSGMLFGHRLSH